MFCNEHYVGNTPLCWSIYYYMCNKTIDSMVEIKRLKLLRPKVS